MLNKNTVEELINKIQKNRKNVQPEDLDNILFLDFDGVIHLNIHNENVDYSDYDPINYINMFCLEYNYKIVVISSWKNHSDYKELLYKSGLYNNIEIIGKTKSLYSGRESEVIDYLENNHNINKFIIVDDGKFELLSKFHIKPDPSKGFDKEKYQETIKLNDLL